MKIKHEGVSTIEISQTEIYYLMTGLDYLDTALRDQMTWERTTDEQKEDIRECIKFTKELKKDLHKIWDELPF